jgi:hypothetical protein
LLSPLPASLFSLHGSLLLCSKFILPERLSLALLLHLSPSAVFFHRVISTWHSKPKEFHSKLLLTFNHTNPSGNDSVGHSGYDAEEIWGWWMVK